jgi:NADP-dependent 3-hydroxy acid dehydrogenase YdfG
VVQALAREHLGVVAMARRPERLEELRASTAEPVTVVVGDVRDDAACARAVARAVEVLGGLDAIVYAAGVSNLALVHDTSVDEWQRILETNVIGVGRMFAHARPQLTDNHGQVVVLSSVSEHRPKPGLVPYSASKAALRKLVEGMRTEYPAVAFTIVSIGPTAGTEFNADFDPAVAARLMDQWRAGGFLAPGQMDVDEVAHGVIECLLSPVRTEELVLLPRPERAPVR